VKTSKQLRRLINDALNAGHEIREETTLIRIFPLKRGRPGIDIWGDGTATRNDIDLSLTLTIRTQKVMREILDL
jgi:hypothetical protein